MPALGMRKDNMSFINKIPKWLRWILFLPVALIAALIVTIPFGVVLIMVEHVSPYKDVVLFTKYLIEIIRHFIQGYVFIWLGSLIAPSRKIKISIMLIVIAIIICLGSVYKTILYYQETHNTFYIPSLLIVASICAIIGAITAYYITLRRYLKNSN